MAILHQETFKQFEPLFVEALVANCELGAPRSELVRAIVGYLVQAGYNSTDRDELQPYLHYFVEQVLDGVINPFPKGGFLQGLAPPSRPRFLPFQRDLFTNAQDREGEAERALIEQLIAATTLYDTTEAVHELLEFTTKLREFAPFNAMLLHIQKPGLTHAATAQDWWKRFKRAPKKGTRPLLVLRTMGPVDFVFDILDTEGEDVPVDAFSFPTFGDLSEAQFQGCLKAVRGERIDIVELDSGDAHAGWIRLLETSKAKTGKNHYQLAYNRNHPAPTRFVTIAHELAHLYLGHLGEDRGRRVPDARRTPHNLREVEAEMVAYLVARRNGLSPRSESYLAKYKGALKDLNLYGVMRSANAVETALGISAHHLWLNKYVP